MAEEHVKLKILVLDKPLLYKLTFAFNGIAALVSCISHKKKATMFINISQINQQRLLHIFKVDTVYLMNAPTQLNVKQINLQVY